MIDRKTFVQMTDIVAIGQEQHFTDMKKLAKAAGENNFWLVYGHQCYTEFLIETLRKTDVKVGGPLNFGLGMDATEQKVFAAKYFLSIGCDEIDMVMNLSFLKDGWDEKVLDDIKKVREIVPCIFKVIIEAPLLNHEELKRACEIVVDAKADFIKTGTGVYGATTLEMVKEIKKTAGNKIGIKAAGGIGSAETVRQMVDAGVTRFGINYRTAVKIAEDLQ